MKHKSIFFSLSLIFSSFCLSAQELPKEVVWQEIEGVNVPIPPQTHPRLYVRSSDLPALKERLKTPQAQQTLSLMKELSKDRTPAEEAAVTNRGFRYYYEMRGVTSRVQLQALDYLLEGDKRLARRAITAMLDTLQRASFGTRSDLSRASGAMLITGAMVYDWCYDPMKSSEKQAYIKEFIRLAKSMECGYPQGKTENGGGEFDPLASDSGADTRPLHEGEEQRRLQDIPRYNERLEATQSSQSRGLGMWHPYSVDLALCKTYVWHANARGWCAY